MLIYGTLINLLGNAANEDGLFGPSAFFHYCEHQQKEMEIPTTRRGPIIATDFRVLVT